MKLFSCYDVSYHFESLLTIMFLNIVCIVDDVSKTQPINYYANKMIKSLRLPNKDNTPHAIHITKLIPVDPVLSSSPDGETKIPEPENSKRYLICN